LFSSHFGSVLEFVVGYLEKNRIGGEGLKWIVQADWPKLKYLDLGNIFLKKGATNSWRKV
jgi:hypothetical protein